MGYDVNAKVYIETILTSEKLKYVISKENEDICSYLLDYGSKSSFGHLLININVFEDGITFLIGYPIKIKKNDREKVAEFITRISYGLRFGGFEMNYDSGSIRFRSTVFTEQYYPSIEHIKNIFRRSGTIAETYAQPLDRLLKGEVTAQQAANLISSIE